jgi:poly-gamma-glutamate capsule biosynthesis protein CapA/YwtB (metallophosphatase superfamily)
VAIRHVRRRGLLGFLIVAPVTLGAAIAVVDFARGVLAARSEPIAQAAARGDTGPRAGRAAHRRRGLTVAWVGDMTLGSRYGRPTAAGDSLFGAVRATLRRPDLTLGNLEGTLGSRGAAKCGVAVPNCFAFQAAPETAGALRRAGFDGVNLANNHANDYGSAGLQDTVAALARSGVAPTGMPDYVRVFDRAGITLAVVGFASYRWSSPITDLRAAAALVRDAGRRADLVLVLFHGGAEGSDRTATPQGVEYAFGENRGDLRAFARTVIDAGADLVLGSGPHVLRGLERYRGRLVAYSLGNFVGVRNFATQGVLGLSGILDVRLGRDGSFRGGRLHSLNLVDGGTPVPDRSNAAARLVSTLSGQDFGSAAVSVRADGTLAP